MDPTVATKPIRAEVDTLWGYVYRLFSSSSQQAIGNRKTILTSLTPPALSPVPSGGQLFAAALVTPRASGVFQVLCQVTIQNGGTGDSYAIAAAAFTGTSIVIGGGNSSSGGWTVGTTTPPTVTGSGLTEVCAIGATEVTLVASGFGNLDVTGITQSALPIGVPSVIEMALASVGNHGIAAFQVTSLSVFELP